MYSKYEVDGANSFGENFRKPIRGQYFSENHWSAMICDSLLYPTKEVMYTNYDVSGANSFGENSRKPINQSEASIQWEITRAQ